MNAERFSRFLARLGFELLVVFVGVTLAFFAENKRQESARRTATQEIYAAIAAELADHTTVGQRVLDEYVNKQREWNTAFARGERPIPWYMPWRYAGPPHSAWDATLASGGVNLIDRPLFYELAKYYRLVEIYMVPVDATDKFVDEEIVPHLDDGPAAYYLPQKHQLRPKYRAYLDRRRIVLEGAQDGINKGKALLAQLRARAAGPIAVAHP